jgi:hypothetical protein
MTDDDESKLAIVAKRLLAMPHKHRDESKVGKSKPTKKPKAKDRKALKGEKPDR